MLSASSVIRASAKAMILCVDTSGDGLRKVFRDDARFAEEPATSLDFDGSPEWWRLIEMKMAPVPRLICEEMIFQGFDRRRSQDQKRDELIAMRHEMSGRADLMRHRPAFWWYEIILDIVPTLIPTPWVGMSTASSLPAYLASSFPPLLARVGRMSTAIILEYGKQQEWAMNISTPRSTYALRHERLMQQLSPRFNALDYKISP